MMWNQRLQSVASKFVVWVRPNFTSGKWLQFNQAELRYKSHDCVHSLLAQMSVFGGVFGNCQQFLEQLGKFPETGKVNRSAPRRAATSLVFKIRLELPSQAGMTKASVKSLQVPIVESFLARHPME